MNDDMRLYRVNEQSMKYYDTRFTEQLNNTGGRVDETARRYNSKDLYDSQYRIDVLNRVKRQKSIVDLDPRHPVRINDQVSKRFFRSSDLYIVPTKNGTGDKSFQASLKKSYTTNVKNNAGNGGPIRLPSLPQATGLSRYLGSDAANGYIQCMTVGHKIPKKGVVPLASSPQNIQDNISVETASDTALGSSQGFTLFSNTGTRQVAFSFDVYADYLPDPYNNVREYCKALKQMNYPVYSGLSVNSPDVIFIYGGIRIRGIPQITCSYSNTTKKGIVDKASISVQITETEAITEGEAKI